MKRTVIRPFSLSDNALRVSAFRGYAAIRGLDALEREIAAQPWRLAPWVATLPAIYWEPFSFQPMLTDPAWYAAHQRGWNERWSTRWIAGWSLAGRPNFPTAFRDPAPPRYLKRDLVIRWVDTPRWGHLGGAPHDRFEHDA